MKKKPEHRRLTKIALCSAFTGAAFIIISFYSSPDFVAKTFSPDGLLESSTIFLINMLRTGLCIAGIVLLSSIIFFLFKPYWFESLVTKIDIKNTYLSVGIWFFSLITLIIGLPNVVKSMDSLHNKIDHRDSHSLRMEFHGWYRRHYNIIEFIQNNISQNESLLINGEQHICFFSYYLAPMPIYKYSDIFAEELERAKHKYYVLNITWDKKDKIIHWSILEKLSNTIIIQKTERSF